MRVVALIFMTLSFLVGGTCAGILFKNIENRMGGTDYSVVEKLQAQIDDLTKSGIDVKKMDDPEIQETLEILEKIPAKWKVDVAGPLGILSAISAFIMVIIAFMKKAVVKKISLAVAVMSLVLWIVTPNIEAGMFSGANPKSIALIALIGLVVSSLFAFLSYQLHARKMTAK